MGPSRKAMLGGEQQIHGSERMIPFATQLGGRCLGTKAEAQVVRPMPGICKYVRFPVRFDGATKRLNANWTITM